MQRVSRTRRRASSLWNTCCIKTSLMKVINRSGLVFAAARLLMTLARLMLLMTKDVLRNPCVLVRMPQVVSMAS